MVGTLLALGLALGLAGRAAAVDIEMSVDATGCSGYVAGVGLCVLSEGQSQITVTWTLSGQQTLNGYDLAVTWDSDELTLLSTAQLHPDTAAPLAWSIEPSDPTNSRALVFDLLPGVTTSLFRLVFAVDTAHEDGLADISWAANGDGLAPGTVVLDNGSGAAIDVAGPVAVPALPPAGLAILVLLLARSARFVRRG